MKENPILKLKKEIEKDLDTCQDKLRKIARIKVEKNQRTFIDDIAEIARLTDKIEGVKFVLREL